MIILALFAVPNVIGLMLWRRRGTLSCYGATQSFLPVMGAFGFLTIYVLEHRNLWDAIQGGGSVSALLTYAILGFVVALLMVTFYFRFGRS